MALATKYNIPITWPALSPLGDDAYLSNLTKLVQTFPPKEASIDWVRKWVDACLDLRKCVTSSSVSWMGHDLHSMTFKQLSEYLVECGLGSCKAKDVARDIFYAREVGTFLDSFFRASANRS
ncbi:hypothetical protein CGCSCA5_v011214 [Colletotrichum siamense]|nr:hypothetical protein CGCSCA5_v011214 [Colletotrichum siamense]